MNVLVLNAGSSSQKSGLYDLPDRTLPDDPVQPLWEAQIDWTHQKDAAEIQIETATGQSLQRVMSSESRQEVLGWLLQTLWQEEVKVIDSPQEIAIAAHRVVHGGRKYRESTQITPAVKEAIARLIPLAPSHNPASLEGIAAVESLLPQIPQVAVFDTAFHAGMPDAAAIYPGPYNWVEQNIRRYGFHGISHQYCAERTAQVLGRSLSELRLITCHLGNGCSLAAIREGRSIDTTMGFTPMEGVMMGSRSGSVDPGILLYLMREQGCSAEELDRMLNKQSGLLGISGISNDMRQISEAIAQGHERAKLAMDLFIHRLKAGIGAMLASLGGVDALVFTGGIGEHSAPIRAAVCAAFGFLGLALDQEKNQAHPKDQDIAIASSQVRVVVIHAQEDWALAQQCWLLAQRENLLTVSV